MRIVRPNPSTKERIASEMTAAEGALAVTEYTADQIENTIEHAVAFATNCHDAYMAADEVVRREMNQAFFDRILVTEDGVVEWSYNQPFAMLMSAHGVAGPVKDDVSVTDMISAESVARNRARNYCKRRDPNWLVRVFPQACSKEQLLAERGGFEPPVTVKPQRFSRPTQSSALPSLRP